MTFYLQITGYTEENERRYTMARDKAFYRDNLEILNTRYPDHDMLSFEEIKAVTGWSDTRTIKKYLGRYIANERICKPALARYMCGEK